MSISPRTVLITGGTGSFGKTMVHHLLDTDVEEIRILSRDEEKQDAMRNDLSNDRLRFYIGDIRDRDSVDRAIAGADCVFHAAALKQVPSCEFFPLEAVRTNILGSENIIRSAIAHGVRSLVCLSTDKAVFPVSSMGMSKAMMEKCAMAAARELGAKAATTVSCVRYGNVMYSRGSVLPLFVRQLSAKKPITVTEPSMTRFLMPLRESVALVDHAFNNARQGDLFIKKAAASSIADLVTAMLDLFNMQDHRVECIGWRHAEKLYETLATAEELANSEDMGEYYRIRLDDRNLNYQSYFSEGNTNTSTYEDFHSHNAQRLNIDEIKALLLTLPEIRRDLAEAGVAVEDTQ